MDEPRVKALVGAAAVALLGVGVAWPWAMGDDEGQPATVTTARTSQGSLSFTVSDPSWRLLECDADEGDCIRVATRLMLDIQAATISLVPPNPVEGTPVDLLLNPEVSVPGARPVVVDGLPAVRLDPTGGQDAIVVAGRARSAVGHTFLVVCPLGDDADRARTLCDQLLATLKVSR